MKINLIHLVNSASNIFPLSPGQSRPSMVSWMNTPPANPAATNTAASTFFFPNPATGSDRAGERYDVRFNFCWLFICLFLPVSCLLQYDSEWLSQLRNATLVILIEWNNWLLCLIFRLNIFLVEGTRIVPLAYWLIPTDLDLGGQFLVSLYCSDSLTASFKIQILSFL